MGTPLKPLALFDKDVCGVSRGSDSLEHRPLSLSLQGQRAQAATARSPHETLSAGCPSTSQNLPERVRFAPGTRWAGGQLCGSCGFQCLPSWWEQGLSMPLPPEALAPSPTWAPITEKWVPGGALLGSPGNWVIYTNSSAQTSEAWEGLRGSGS